MGTKLKLTEDELIELIEKSIKKKINEQPEDLDMLDVEEFEDEIEDEEDDYRKLKTLRKIEQGEELTVKYQLYKIS